MSAWSNLVVNTGVPAASYASSDSEDPLSPVLSESAFGMPIVLPSMSSGPRNVYVSGLPRWADDEWLRHEFSRFGPIISAKVMTKSGNDKSYGFVQFTEPKMAADSVAGMNACYAGEGFLRVKLADRDKDKGVSQPPSTNLYVNNLPTLFGEYEVSLLFSPFGPISSLVVLTDSKTADSRGVALVQFYKVADAAKAVRTLHGALLPNYDRPLEVKYAESKHQKHERKGYKSPTVPASVREKGQKKPKDFNFDLETSVAEEVKIAEVADIVKSLTTQSGRSTVAALMAQAPTTPLSPLPIDSRFFGSSDSLSENLPRNDSTISNNSFGFPIEHMEQGNTKEANRLSQLSNVYVSGLPQDANDEWLRNHFCRFGPILSAKVMTKSGNDKSYGFVQFTEPSMASASVDMLNGRYVGGAFLHVKLADRDKDKGVAHPPSKNLYVNNLPTTHGAMEVSQLFGPFGSISSLVVLTDSNTSDSRGVALVQFFKVEDATKAVNDLHGLLLPGHDRPLEVKYADSKHQRPARKRGNKSGSIRKERNSKGRAHDDDRVDKLDVDFERSVEQLTSGLVGDNIPPSPVYSVGNDSPETSSHGSETGSGSGSDKQSSGKGGIWGVTSEEATNSLQGNFALLSYAYAFRLRCFLFSA